MTRVRLESVRKQFARDSIAVHGLDLEIESGELLVFVGPSGCGKSTTLRMIAGLESVSSGKIHFDGEDVTERSPRERDVAMVFQNYALYPHMTVERNLMFPLRMRKVGRTDARKKACALAESLGLGELLHRKPRELSGGQQQRVALGRALIREPRIFLLDEPLSNLDAKTRVSMRAEIKRLHRELGTTMVYVTHDQSEAMALGERIAVLRGGRLEQLATPKELYQRPSNRFVGSFIGSPAMSFHDVVAEGERVRIAGALLEGVRPPGRPALAGLRPHELRVVQEGAAVAGPRIEGVVQQVEAHGHESFVTVRCGAEELTAVAAGIFEEETGAAVLLELQSGELRYFDARTGERV